MGITYLLTHSANIYELDTSYGTLLLDLGLVPPDSEKAKKLTEREVCELLKEAKEELLQKAFEDLDWIEDQYHLTCGPRQPYYFLRYRLGYDLSTVRKVEFDPNELANEILEHGKKLLIKGYAKDGTILAKVDYWQEAGFYVYWNRRTGRFRVGEYSYGPISYSTEKVGPAYDPVTGENFDRAGMVQSEWKGDKLTSDEELVARVHIHPKTFYRTALYPSAADIGSLDDIRNNAIVHNQKWDHVQDFILFPPTKNYELAKLWNGKQNDQITMLIHDSRWNRFEAITKWDRLRDTEGQDLSVLNELDEHIFRLDETGKVVEGKSDLESYDLDNKIDETCKK